MISKLQEQGRVTECCSWQTDDDFILVSCLIDSDILYFYLSGFDLTGHIGQDKSKDNIMVNKVVDNYLNIISTKQDLKQIEDKGYAKPYAADSRKVICLGINFSSEKGTIDDWKFCILNE